MAERGRERKTTAGFWSHCWTCRSDEAAVVSLVKDRRGAKREKEDSGAWVSPEQMESRQCLAEDEEIECRKEKEKADKEMKEKAKKKEKENYAMMAAWGSESEMARTRNSNNNAPSTAIVDYSVAQGRVKKVLAKKKGRPAKATQLPRARQTKRVVHEQVPQSRPTTVPAQVVRPLDMGEAFNVVKGALEMFTTFMENQGIGGSDSTTHGETR
ncbi:hypothetical protein HAX54_000803 [Datura stramonium]|uniref:Uncharacterized protein n=1 Tax=Datura stramonium TaxID=4076 RepID=A0ABS8T2J5_DATST|nr:hypothetical protein [Datura stramonium]